MRGMSETVAALLDAGVPPDTMGAEGNTALHLASYNKEEGAVAVLMRAGEPFFLSFFQVHLGGTLPTWTWNNRASCGVRPSSFGSNVTSVRFAPQSITSCCGRASPL